MKNLFPILFLLTFFSISSLDAQNTITGSVFDEKDDGVFFATVALYNHKDSSLINAESTDDKGFFKMKNIKDGVYYLEATMIGFDAARRKNIVFPKDNGVNFELTMAESAIDLATAEVIGKKPLLEQEADRLVVNVADNVTSLNGSLIDVMKKVPGMIVVGDKLSMAGQQNMTILINGKTTQYMDVQALMRDMPGDNIQKVEVIHQPGAEFEAAGTGPVINIVLKKNALFGTNGSVTLGAGRGELWRYKSSLNLSHYEGNVNINGSVGYRDNPGLERLQIDRRVKNVEIAPGIFDDIHYDQESYDPDESSTWRANLNLNWDLTENQSLGFQSRMVDSRSKYDLENQTELISMTGSFPTEKQLTVNQNDNAWKLYIVNPFYSLQLDTSGQKLDLDFSYINISNDGESVLNTNEVNFGGYEGGNRYVQPGTTDLYVGKLDYSYPFTKMLKFQTGLKYSFADLDNNLIAYGTEPEAESAPKTDDEWILNTTASNHFLFDETIAAAYAKLNWKAGKWSGTAGLRYEHSESEGYSVELDSTLDRTISRAFPSLSLKREITKHLGATMAYSYRLDRPRYSTLNPFAYYLDPYTSQRGNPNITATFTHSMRANLTFDNQPFFNVEYKISEDPIVEVIAQETSGEAYKTEVNFKQKNNFSTSLFFPLDFIPHISGYAGGIVNHTSFDSPYLDEVYKRDNWSFTSFIQINSKLPGDINAEISGWYYSGGLEGLIIGEHLYGVDFGASRKFLDDKLKISVGIDNLLVRFFHGSVDYSNIDLGIINKWEAPVFNLQATYKFGNQHMKGTKRRQSGARDIMNRTGRG